jgi:cytochrome c5
MSEQHSHENDEKSGNPVGMAIAVFVGAIGLVIGIMLLAHFAISTRTLGSGLEKDKAEAATKANIAPVVTIATSNPVETAPAPAPAPAAAAPVKVADGQATYKAACSACHTAGVAGAPKTGDKGQWAPRIAQGKDTLYKHAIGGFQGKVGVMPAKGGNAALSDADVKAAVDYMVASAK